MPGDGEVGPHEEKRTVSGSERGLGRAAGREQDLLTALALALAAVAVISAVMYIAEHTGDADRSAVPILPPASRELFR